MSLSPTVPNATRARAGPWFRAFASKPTTATVSPISTSELSANDSAWRPSGTSSSSSTARSGQRLWPSTCAEIRSLLDGSRTWIEAAPAATTCALVTSRPRLESTTKPLPVNLPIGDSTKTLPIAGRTRWISSARESFCSAAVGAGVSSRASLHAPTETAAARTVSVVMMIRRMAWVLLGGWSIGRRRSRSAVSRRLPAGVVR